MITHVAIIWRGVTYALPKPNRHHDVVRHIYKVTGAKRVSTNAHPDVQGFLATVSDLPHAFFLNREAALAHAIECGQVPATGRRSGGGTMPDLYSEDLW